MSHSVKKLDTNLLMSGINNNIPLTEFKKATTKHNVRLSDE